MIDKIKEKNKYSLSWIFNKLTRRRYWYQLKYSYKVDDREIFNFTCQVGLIHKAYILNARQLKREVNPYFFNKTLRKYLKGGKYYVEPIAYLGHIKIV